MAGIQQWTFADAGEIPNHPTLPVVVYKRPFGAAPEGDIASFWEGLFPRHGWRPAWRYGVYPFPHYHSTAHEILGVFRGHANIRLGHTAGVTAHVEAGDVVVLPAGTGHQNLGASDDFQVVGGYPDGQRADLLRGQPGERPAADARIRAVALPTSDPVRGRDGPLVELWKLG